MLVRESRLFAKRQPRLHSWRNFTAAWKISSSASAASMPSPFQPVIPGISIYSNVFACPLMNRFPHSLMIPSPQRCQLFENSDTSCSTVMVSNWIGAGCKKVCPASRMLFICLDQYWIRICNHLINIEFRRPGRAERNPTHCIADTIKRRRKNKMSANATSRMTIIFASFILV
jgi:hypothetical protein